MDNVFKLLSEYKFEMKETIPDHLICVYCKTLLNKAKQVKCGCRFCSKCIEALVKISSKCPGTSDFCEELSLLEAQID